MSRPPKFPDLRDGQYAVVCAEVETGIVLSLTGVRAVGDAETYRVFATLVAAQSRAAELGGDPGDPTQDEPGK